MKKVLCTENKYDSEKGTDRCIGKEKSVFRKEKCVLENEKIKYSWIKFESYIRSCILGWKQSLNVLPL